MKTCIYCQGEKPLTDYYAKASAKDGRASMCKVCQKFRMRLWRKKHPRYPQKQRLRPGKYHKYLAYNKAYYQTTKESV